VKSTGDALLSDVIEHPEDDTPRLVYADWLEEHGGDAHRAEAIRLSVRRRHLDHLDPEAWVIDARLRQYQARQERDSWFAGLPELDGVTWCVPYGGFTSMVRVWSVQRLRQHEDAIFGAAPVTNLAVMLEGEPGEGDPDASALLAGSRHLHRVRRLELNGPVAPEIVGLPVLGASAAIAGVRELDLGECAHQDDLLESLAESKPWPSLEALNLYRNLFHAPGLRALAEAPMMTTLRKLELGRCYVGDNGLRTLLRSPHIGRLRHLNLAENWLHTRVIRELVSVQWEQLEELDLSSNELGPAAIRHLGESPHMRNLRHLDLSGNHTLRDPSVAALAKSEHLRGLRVLSLGFWRPSHRGLAALASATWLSNLARLDLMSIDLDDAGIKVLAGAPLDSLRWLELNYNELTPGKVRALLCAPWIANLTHLDLNNNAIGEEGARALAQAPQLSNLVHLDVSSNKLNDAAGKVLRERFGDRVIVKHSWER
jgi:uncharacterized protein (TIGR02996 family)